MGKGNDMNAQDNTDGGSGAGNPESGTLLTPKGKEGSKSSDSGNSEGEGDGESGDGPAGAPEEYEAFSIPEGRDLNEEILGGFKDLAREMNLSQEDAQKFVDLGLQLTDGDPVEAVTKMQEEQWTEAREKWVEDLQKDPDFGGDNFEANVQSAQRTLRDYGSEELTEYLENTGLGDFPPLVRMFTEIGKALGESKSIGGDGANPPKSMAEAMFPSMVTD